MITYGSYSSVKRGSVGGLKDYFFTTADEHVCTVYKNKRLKYNGTTKVLSLSLDCGVTYPITLDLTGVCDLITYSRILYNGTIGFANQNHFYYSDDNLSTYHESTVIARNGSAFSSAQGDIFKASVHDRDVIVDGVQIVFWGAYSIDYTEINAWKTIDSFHTIKSVFHLGTDFNEQSFRHVEFINCDRTNNVFWMRCGDTVGCPLFKATYNWSTDAVTWELVDIPSDNNRSPQYSSGFGFYDSNFFWAQDGGDNGIWKCLYTDMATPAQWTELINMITAAGSFHACDNGILIAAGYGDYRMYLSYDKGVTAEMKTLTGGPSLGTSPNIGFCFAAIGPDNNNWFRHEIFQGTTQEEGYLSATGITLMMQIIPTAGSN